MQEEKKNTITERDRRNDSYAHVLKYTSIFGGVQGLKILVNVVRNKLAALLLHSTGLGLNAQYMNSAEVANSFTNFGIGFSAVQQLSELFEEGDAEKTRRFVGVIRTWSLLAALCGVLLTLALSFLAHSWFYPDGELSWTDILLLCLFVGTLPLEEGECSILKGMRKLHQMAAVESAIAVCTLLLTIPVYYLMGVRGIVLALALVSSAKVLIHMGVTCRLFSYRVHLFSPQVIGAGFKMIGRGIPFMLTAVFGSITTTILFQYCLNGSDSDIGLYKSAYSLMVTYTGIVFIAFGNDYFPRLSSVNNNRARMNYAINQQVDVSVLLITPLLIAFVLAMPWVMRLLYSSEFLPAVTMAQCAVFYMFFGAITKPMAYSSLAKGDSLMYLFVEAVYNLVFVGLMFYGYHRHGLMGAGVALSLAALFDMLLIGTLYGIRYGVRLRGGTLRLAAIQGSMLMLVVLACMPGLTWLKYAVGLFVFLVSLFFSYRQLSKDVHVTNFFRNKLNRLKP